MALRTVFWGNGNRGVDCLRALNESGRSVEAVVAHPDKSSQWYGSVAAMAEEMGLLVLRPEDPNSDATVEWLRGLKPDLFVLAGYGKILNQNVIDLPALMCLNLHGGKLPGYRGSSPMNWALINGEQSFTLSVIEVDAGVDTGDILLEKSFDIGIGDTIRDLHSIANDNFPSMLLESLSQIEKGTLEPTPQDKREGSYHPLRFPDDGAVFWDAHTALQVHNRVRALTEPYPCAFTFLKGRRVRLISSELSTVDFFGEPGRVYRKTSRGLLACASDRCLWITDAAFEDDGTPLADAVNRYETLATLRESAMMAQANYQSYAAGTATE